MKGIKNYKDSTSLYSECEKQIALKEEFLKIDYLVSETPEAEKGKYYTNGKGTLIFAEDTPLDDWVGFGGKYVTFVMRGQSVLWFRLRNTGEKALKNPTIRLKFQGVFLKEIYDEGWEGEDHLHGLGGFAGAKWEKRNSHNGCLCR